MFTGIIEETGKVLSITNNSICAEANVVLDGTKIGDSISVNGVCLTVTKVDSDKFCADISPETYNITALKYLKTGAYVNLERAVAANGRFGGHIVSGHVDGIAKISKLIKNRNFYDLYIDLPDELSKYVVKKGSIAINGISLTAAEVEKNQIMSAIIPHTYENTVLKYLNQGDYVNIETDILSKYVEKFLSTSDNRAGIDIAFLQENGF